MKNFGKIISDKDIITKEYLDSKGYISVITSKMVTDALGFTPFDSAAFTKDSIKNALGIADWALAANKPSYNFSEIGSKPTTLEGYGITDAVYRSDNFDATSTKPWVLGYSHPSYGWKASGPAMLFGTRNYYARLNVMQEGTDNPTAYLSLVHAEVEYGWAKVLTEKNIRSHAIEISPASEHRATTDNSAFATYAYGDNGWITSGPALAFSNGDYKGLLNISIGNGESHPTRMWLSGVREGTQQSWVEVLTEKNQGVMQVRGRLAATDANTLFSAGSYEFWGGAEIANSPSGYATLLVSRGAANNLYFTSQLLTDAQGHLFSRMNEDGGVDGWRPWRTILDDNNISSYAISQSAADSRYLKLTGGTISGNIFSGAEIYINNDAYADKFFHSKCSAYEIGFGIGAGNVNRGIFDFTYYQWWIMRDGNMHTTITGTVNVFGLLSSDAGLKIGGQTIAKWADVANYITLPYLEKDTFLMPTNAFDYSSGRLEHSYAANALYAADKRFSVSGSGFSYFDASQLFDGSYEGECYARVETGATATMTISNNGSSIIAGYPYGEIYLSFYNDKVPADVTVEVYCNYASQGIGWKTLTLKGRRGVNNDVWYYNNSYYDVTQLRITITASASIAAALTEIDWHLSRAALSNLPIVTKFGIDQELWGRLICQGGITLGNETITSWDDLKASGDYLPLTGGTISGSLSVSGSVYLYSNLKISAGGTFQLGNEEPISSWNSLRVQEVSQTATSGTVSIAPNVLNKWANALTGTLTITFGSGRSGVANYYMIEFTTGSSIPTINLPSGVKWEGGNNILDNLEPNTTYQISILNNLAVGGAF